MARNKSLSPNVDNSNLTDYPNGRIQDNTGSGNGTPVNNFIYSDIHEFKDKLMRLADIPFNGLPDNEANGHQLITALREFASKNDIVQPITTNTGVLSIPVKLSLMLNNEVLICKASVDWTTETQIKGSDNVTFNIALIGEFKTDEYIRLIKTASNIVLVRLTDAVNLDLAVAEFLYLKKASQAQEDAGAVDTVATTPLVNKVTFAKRVNGVDSDTYLATPSQNGLLSMEDKAIIDGIGASPIRNTGWFSGLNPGGGIVGTDLAVSGDINEAEIVAVADGGTVVLVTMDNAMDDTNYLVQLFVESEGDIGNDNNCGNIVFKPISTTTFRVAMDDFGSSTQSLKIHIKVEQLA